MFSSQVKHQCRVVLVVCDVWLSTRAGLKRLLVSVPSMCRRWNRCPTHWSRDPWTGLSLSDISNMRRSYTPDMPQEYGCLEWESFTSHVARSYDDSCRLSDVILRVQMSRLLVNEAIVAPLTARISLCRRRETVCWAMSAKQQRQAERFRVTQDFRVWTKNTLYRSLLWIWMLYSYDIYHCMKF